MSYKEVVTKDLPVEQGRVILDGLGEYLGQNLPAPLSPVSTPNQLLVRYDVGDTSVSVVVDLRYHPDQCTLTASVLGKDEIKRAEVKARVENGLAKLVNSSQGTEHNL